MLKSSKKTQGILEVICGSMFSGKSEELIRRLRRAEFARLGIASFKPHIDTRTNINTLNSHNGSEFRTIPIADPNLILPCVTHQIEVVGIDEVQFFSQELINVICTLLDNGKRVIVAGLDLDFRGIPFGIMPMLLAIADQVTKLKAICSSCGDEAHFTQRLVNGLPAKSDDPLILIGAHEQYQARCRSCHSINQKPCF